MAKSRLLALVLVTAAAAVAGDSKASASRDPAPPTERGAATDLGAGRESVALRSSSEGGTGNLGAVSFPISCPGAVAPAFERGVALLHSFEYKPAREQFEAVARDSPECAIAYWGAAMTYYHQLWDRPSAEDIATARELVHKGQSAKVAGQRERDYLAVAAAFYDGEAARPFDDRWKNYSQATEVVSKHYPADNEAAAFYALSLIASPHAADDHQALRKQAVAILQPLFQAAPQHPGLAHYIIHACDNPAMAQQGLAAARVYATIAPASPHALHMPSHIFARLGLWKDDIQSNLVSKAAAEKLGERAHRLHAMDFLEYAYLQRGENAKAQAVVTEALDIQSGSDDHHMRGPNPDWVRVHFPGMYALETRTWQDARRVAVRADADPEWRALAAWTRAVASGYLRDADTAASAVRSLNDAIDGVRRTSYAYVAEDLQGPRDEAQAWLEFARNQIDPAVALLRRVADKQDAAGKGETEIPAREMLADMLLAANRPADALAEYKQSLKTDPKRRNSLRGAEQAAALCKH